jgi:glycosyltransferase involved in cell wall biosynthesis
MSISSTNVSILLPHFKTLEMVKLCLNCLQEYTDNSHEVIVIDNGSGDHPSLDYLRTVDWIKLLVIEPDDIDPDPNRAHREALQKGLESAQNKYILSLHTDAFILQKGWLDWMLEPMLKNDRLGAVGTYKLEYQPHWRQALIDLKHMLRRQNPSSPSAPYIRSHCALYNREIMDAINLGFLSDETAGRELYFSMLANDYEVKLVSVLKMAQYVAHINHGTMVVNPELCERKKTVTAGEKRILKFYQSDEIQSIYKKYN